jgi:hypothetical protein
MLPVLETVLAAFGARRPLREDGAQLAAPREQSVPSPDVA